MAYAFQSFPHQAWDTDACIEYVWPAVLTSARLTVLNVCAWRSLPGVSNFSLYDSHTCLLSAQSILNPGVSTLRVEVSPQVAGSLLSLKMTVAPSSPVPDPIRRPIDVPLIVLPEEAVLEVNNLFDGHVRSLLSHQQQQQQSQQQQRSGNSVLGQPSLTTGSSQLPPHQGWSTSEASSLHVQQQVQHASPVTDIPGYGPHAYTIEAQNRVIGQVYRDAILPLLEDMKAIVTDAPYHIVRESCRRLVPTLRAAGMNNCLMIMRELVLGNYEEAALRDDLFNPASAGQLVPDSFTSLSFMLNDATYEGNASPKSTSQNLAPSIAGGIASGVSGSLADATVEATRPGPASTLAIGSDLAGGPSSSGFVFPASVARSTNRRGMASDSSSSSPELQSVFGANRDEGGSHDADRGDPPTPRVGGKARSSDSKSDGGSDGAAVHRLQNLQVQAGRDSSSVGSNDVPTEAAPAQSAAGTPPAEAPSNVDTSVRATARVLQPPAVVIPVTAQPATGPAPGSSTRTLNNKGSSGSETTGRSTTSGKSVAAGSGGSSSADSSNTSISKQSGKNASSAASVTSSAYSIYHSLPSSGVFPLDLSLLDQTLYQTMDDHFLLRRQVASETSDSSTSRAATAPVLPSAEAVAVAVAQAAAVTTRRLRLPVNPPDASRWLTGTSRSASVATHVTDDPQLPDTSDELDLLLTTLHSAFDQSNTSSDMLLTSFVPEHDDEMAADPLALSIDPTQAVSPSTSESDLQALARNITQQAGVQITNADVASGCGPSIEAPGVLHAQVGSATDIAQPGSDFKSATLKTDSTSVLIRAGMSSDMSTTRNSSLHVWGSGSASPLRSDMSLVEALTTGAASNLGVYQTQRSMPNPEIFMRSTTGSSGRIDPLGVGAPAPQLQPPLHAASAPTLGAVVAAQVGTVHAAASTGATTTVRRRRRAQATLPASAAPGDTRPPTHAAAASSHVTTPSAAQQQLESEDPLTSTRSDLVATPRSPGAASVDAGPASGSSSFMTSSDGGSGKRAVVPRDPLAWPHLFSACMTGFSQPRLERHFRRYWTACMWMVDGAVLASALLIMTLCLAHASTAYTPHHAHKPAPRGGSPSSNLDVSYGQQGLTASGNDASKMSLDALPGLHNARSLMLAALLAGPSLVSTYLLVVHHRSLRRHREAVTAAGRLITSCALVTALGSDVLRHVPVLVTSLASPLIRLLLGVAYAASRPVMARHALVCGLLDSLALTAAAPAASPAIWVSHMTATWGVMTAVTLCLDAAVRSRFLSGAGSVSRSSRKGSSTSPLQRSRSSGSHSVDSVSAGSIVSFVSSR